MYPNLYFFLKDVFGIEPFGFTRYINSFGLMVAIAFIIAALFLSSELKRKETEGLLSATEEKEIVGNPASISELLFHFIFGFFVGYKIIGVFLNDAHVNPQDYIFSSQGSWLGGIGLALLFTFTKYQEKKKQQLEKPTEKTFKIWPHERVGDITVMAAIAGFLGAKVFDNLENWDRFIQDPIGNLLAPSGLTWYGGLILAAITILIFARRKKIGLLHLVDSAAPALLIAYAIGRMGCHIAGDGDWGIFNDAYAVNDQNKVILADSISFKDQLTKDPQFTNYLVREYGNIDKVPHTTFKGSEILPNWFWAYNYPHNVNEVGSVMNNCKGPYCNQLTPPVFPTTLYEIIACLLLFLILWSVRKKFKIPGQVFGIYLIMNGAERFLVEKIRVNSTYSIFGFHPTQAEIISTLLIIGGIFLLFKVKKTNSSLT